MRTIDRNRKPFRPAAGLLARSPAAPREEPGPGSRPGPAAGDRLRPTQKPAGAGEKGFTFRFDPLVIGVHRHRTSTPTRRSSQEYRDVSSGFVLPSCTSSARATGDRELDLNAENVRRDDARYTLDYGVAGPLRTSFDYNKIPHHFGNDGHMLWTRTGPGRLEIADPIQAALQAAIAAQLATNPAGINFTLPEQPARPLPGDRPGDRPGSRARPLWRRLDLGAWGRSSWGIEYTHENRTRQPRLRRQLRLQQRHRAAGADRLRHHRRRARRRVERRQPAASASATATRSSRTTSAR